MKWEMKKLGDVCGKIETRDPRKNPDTTFRYVDVSAVCSHRSVIVSSDSLVGIDAPSRARRVMRVGDILFATIRPTLRRIATVPSELDGEVCSTGFFVIRPDSSLHSDFTFYYVQSGAFMEAMESLQRGASYPAVSDGDLRNQPIPIPPLPEQERIVAILDEAFEGIATATRHAERNLENGSSVLQSTLRRAFSNGTIELADHISVQNGFAFKSAHYVEDGHFVVRIANVQDGRLDLSKPKYIVPNKKDLRFELVVGDLLVSLTGNIGRTCRVESEHLPALLNQRVARVRSLDAIALDEEFLFWFMRSEHFREGLIEGGHGAAQQNASTKDLLQLKIPLPPLETQKAIVAHLDALSAETRRLEEIYERKLACLAELKQSLLQRAFAGEL